MQICYPLEEDRPISYVRVVNQASRFLSQVISRLSGNNTVLKTEGIDGTEIVGVNMPHQLTLLEAIILLKTENKKTKNKLILHLFPEYETPKCYHYAMYMAIHNGDIRLLQRIGISIDLDAYEANLLPTDQDVLDYFHQTYTIHRAIEFPSFLEYYLRDTTDIDIEEKTFKGRTPLELAIKEKEVKSCQLLIQAGAPVHWFHDAIRQPDILRVLVTRPENIDRFREGKTAIHSAISGHNEQCVQILLDAGADPMLPTERSRYWWQLCWNGSIANMIMSKYPPSQYYDLLTLDDIAYCMWFYHISKEWANYNHQKYRKFVNIKKSGQNVELFCGGLLFSNEWKMVRSDGFVFNNCNMIHGRHLLFNQDGIKNIWCNRGFKITYGQSYSFDQILNQVIVLMNLPKIRPVYQQGIKSMFCWFTCCRQKYLPEHLRRHIGGYVLG